MPSFNIGPSVGKSQVQQFHDFLLSEIGNIPLATQWVLQIDNLPTLLKQELSSKVEPGRWQTVKTASAIEKAITQGAFADGGVCLFVQGAQTPREEVGTTVIGPNDGFRGGLLGAPVSTGRSPLQYFNIAFIETNYSFLDFVIRPWVIYTAHMGLIARAANDPKNIKTTLQLYFYDRGNGKIPSIRKTFRFYNAAPTHIEGIISTWDDNKTNPAYTTWTYTHYDVSTESISSAISNLRDTIVSNPFINAFQSPQSLVPQLVNPLIPSYNLGSEAFSNPTGYNVNDSFKSTGGSLLGGSYAPSVAFIPPFGT